MIVLVCCWLLLSEASLVGPIIVSIFCSGILVLLFLGVLMFFFYLSFKLP